MSEGDDAAGEIAEPIARNWPSRFAPWTRTSTFIDIYLQHDLAEGLITGYAVNFVRLTPEQQRDVINRTFHGSL